MGKKKNNFLQCFRELSGEMIIRHGAVGTTIIQRIITFLLFTTADSVNFSFFWNLILDLHKSPASRRSLCDVFQSEALTTVLVLKLTPPNDAVMTNSHVFINDLAEHCSGLLRTGTPADVPPGLPKNGGASLCCPISALGLKRVFGHIFTDVSGNECEPQHGGQRRIVEQNSNLRIQRKPKIIKSNLFIVQIICRGIYFSCMKTKMDMTWQQR